MNAGSDIVSFFVKLMGEVYAKHPKSVPSVSPIGVDVKVFVVRQKVGMAALQEVVAQGVVEIPMSHELNVGHAVDGVAQVGEDIAIVAAVVALGIITFGCSCVIEFLIHKPRVFAVSAVGRSAPSVSAGVVVTTAQVYIYR